MTEWAFSIATQRSKIKLTEREHNVLVDLLNGLEMSEISNNRHLTKSNVNHTVTSLKRKFTAHSTIHLLVLSIMEKKYYDILTTNTSDHRSVKITEREVDVVKHVLQGRFTKEIAKLLGLSVRTIEGHRYEFSHKSSTKTSRDFINACLQNGILKLIPFEFEFIKSKLNSREIIELSRSACRFYPDELSAVTNEYGFIYFDFQNRFITKDSFNYFLYNNIRVHPFIFSLILSGIPLPIISHVSELSERYLMARQMEVEVYIMNKGGYLSFLKELIQLNYLQLDQSHGEFEWAKISKMKLILFLENIANCVPMTKKMKLTRFDQKTILDEEKMLLREFNCDDNLSLIVQAVHLGIFQLR